MKSKLIILIIFVMSLFVLIPSEVKAYNDTKNENIVTVANIVESSSSGVPDYVGNGKDICDTTLTDFIKSYWKIIMIFAPALAILMISVDFFKAITSSDADLLKKAASSALKRTLAFILLLFLPFILNTLFGWFGLEICF